jgi:integrase
MVNTTPGQTNRIFWDFLLPDGSRSTDKQHWILLESFREVCWGMFQDGGWYGATLSVGSAPHLSTGMKELFCWMNYRGFSHLGELTEEVWTQYHSDLPTLLLNRKRFYDDDENLYGSSEGDNEEFQEDDESVYAEDIVDDEASEFDHVLNAKQAEDTEADLDEDDRITYGQVSARIKTAYYVYAQRSRLQARGLPYSDLVPFAGRKVKAVAGELAAHVVKRIPPLPDDIVQPLLQAALKWVDHYSADVIRLQTTYLDARKTAVESGLARATINKRVREAIADFSFDAHGVDGEAWRDRLKAFNALIEDGRETIYRQVETLRYFTIRVRSAAVCILQYMVGLRSNEICGLEGGWNDQEGLPSCVFRRYSSSGLMEMFYLRGVVSKGKPGPREAEWLLGCRPAGATYLPPPVRAVCVLEKLFAPWRTLGGRPQLVVHFTSGRGVPWNSESISAFKVSTLIRNFKRFVSSEVDFSRLPFESKRGEDLSIYKQSEGRSILASQGRKTFAAYVLDVRTSLIPAVRQHFKHYNDATTESAYYPTEVRLRNEVDDVIESETINFFVSVVQGKRLAGRMGDVISQHFGRKRFADVKDYAECVRRVADIVTTHDLRIFFSDHGNCFIKAKPLESRCRAASGTVSWSATSPDFSIRNPGMCGGCGCFAIDVSHFGFWAEREEHYLMMVKKAKRAGREQEFAVHKARAGQAGKVVAVLTQFMTERGHDNGI